ncbi:MAG: M14 family zinc carboxypeptidase [bacterium]|nr:M14 family zinc carboxypeptidase [bacterium]
MKKIIIALVVIVLIGLGVWFFMNKSAEAPTPVVTAPTTTTTATVVTEEPVDTTRTVLGTSVENRDITAYHYGTGAKEVLFVGGIHGGYEWNTALVAYELMDYLTANPKVIPSNVRVTVIPVLNPDGLKKVTGKEGRFTKADIATSESVVVSGRFNASGVDLNRNFDCDWQTKAVWMNKPVSGGSKVFSEPESMAIKNYIETHSPVATVVWYSSAGGVFSSNCHNGILPETKTLTNLFAKASGYKAYETFDFYETTGDMVNWLAKKNVPAISILLTTHDDTEWSKNLAGIKATLNHYAK